MRYTFIQVEEWYGLWRGDELVSDGHSMSIIGLTDFTDQDGDISLDAVSAFGSKADTELMAHGSFASLSLDEWLALANEADK